MQIKKIIYILLSLAILFISTSCNTTTVETASETSIQTEQPIEYKTIEPPEDGWTLELLESVFYINSIQTKPNFELALLGDGFSFNINDLILNESNKIISGYVNYYGKKAFLMGTQYEVMDDIKENINISESNMTILLCNEQDNKSTLDLAKFVVINGVHIGSKKSDIIKFIGNPKNQNSPYTYSYDLIGSKGSVLFGLNEDSNSVDSIWITLIN
ncbi:MAG: hypothetical protein LBM59_02215 [Ruminococcus sp.]|jgi:hypothetical protein|nr:hypothetical protein [Ruminococcus sp.]